MTRWKTLAVLGCGLLVAQQGIAQKRSWRAADEFKTKSFSDLAVSPEGDVLLFVLHESDLAKNRRYSNIWVLPTSGGPQAARQVQQAPRALTDRGSFSSPRWSPDGRRIAYFASDAKGLSLWVMNSDGDQKKHLTGLERSNAYLGWGDNVGNPLSWSPDGKTLAFTAAGPGYYRDPIAPPALPNENEPMVVERALFKATYYFSDLRRTHIWTIPVGGGEAKQISSGDYDYHSISWSPDGKSIACISNRTGRDDFDSNTDICLLSPEGGPVRQLTNTPGPEYQPFWSPDGERIAFLGRERPGRSREADPELKKVYVINPDGSERVNLTAPLDRRSTSPRWSVDSRNVYFTAQNSGAGSLYSAPRDGGPVEPIVDSEGTVGSFAVNDKHEVFFAYADDTRPSELYGLPEGVRNRNKLTAFNDPVLSQVATIPTEKFAYPSVDDLTIEGWIMKPGGFEKRKRHPMILVVHGGPHGQYGFNFYGQFQYLASAGYVVVFLNPRGSTGRGQAFSDMCVGDLGGGDYKDLMAGVDYVLEKYDFIDPNRLGVTGTSYGGYMTNWIITHTDRFKAAVPVSSISNLISMWGTAANYLWFPSDMGFRPMDDYQRAWDASPLKYVKNCRTPTLFISGAWDFITPVYQAEEMFIALKSLGIDAAHASYPNEGHGVRNQPRHTHDYYERVVAWFDKYLK